VTTDEQLVRAALAGSRPAFGQLVDRYQHRLLRFLLTRCASRADAEDALQDTFINAYRYLASYKSRWQFSTWLYRIAIRNAARQGAPVMGGFEEVSDPSADPLTACIAESERENVWLTARRLLSPDAFTALWLRYAEDLPVRDVARALGRPESWTKVTLLRARRTLSRALAAGHADESESKAYG
jgi:RNA polymerase sigma-70 factor (ECF subfamily)